MSGWETLNCENHPERIALERCEVCNKPLCAYCLYYTGDGGTVFKRVSIPGLLSPLAAVVKIHPGDSDRVYAGFLGAGVYRSEDGGATFEAFNNGLKTYPVYDLMLSPSDPNVVFVSTLGGSVFRVVDDS